MKLVLNAWLISMMQGIAESAQLAKTLGFTPTSCGAPWKAARWRRPMSK
jgi:3-hydroxyisobutyrate dehydrogenase-like beta-hydroxyacid dehydrogenase